MRHLFELFRCLGLALILALGVSAGPSQAQSSGGDLTLATWGGFYQKAQTRVLAEPFGFQSNKSIEVVTYTGQANEVRQRVEAYRNSGQSFGWDVIDLERADAEQLCFEGYIQPLQLDSLGTSGGNNDFIQGGMGLCWVGNVVWSQSFAFDRRLYNGAEPFALSDFFDQDLFPGRRVLTNSAEAVLELALMSEGVDPSQVYDLLQTENGISEALSVLDRLRGSVNFVGSTDQVFNMLKTGRAGMGLIHHFDALRETRAAGDVIGYLWDNHVVDMDVFAIPAGADNPELARDFIANVSRPAYQSAMATVTGYGPARLSAAEAAREDLRAWLPTAPENIGQALVFSAEFWKSNAGINAQEAYEEWRAGL